MGLVVPIFYLTAIIKKKQVESFNASTHSSMTHSYPFFFMRQAWTTFTQLIFYLCHRNQK